jgi:putative nucleotidyltransferase with HDIG domain
VTPRPEVRHPWLFRLLCATVVVVAGVLFVVMGGHAGSPSRLAAAAVLLFMCLMEWSPVELPGGGYTTASEVLIIPSLIWLGPFTTALLNAVSVLIVQGFVLRRAWPRVVVHMSVLTLANFAAWTVFVATGGRIESGFRINIVPLVACGAVFFLSNTLLISTLIGLSTGPSLWRAWQRNFLDGILHHLSFVALGILAAATYLTIGVWGLLLFAVPFLVARHSFVAYMNIRGDLKNFVRALSEVLEEIDPYTRHHSVRVAQYAVRLARGLRLQERDVEEIEYAALVHDLGKIGPQHQHILQKPGTLSYEEQRTLRAHPAAGAEIVAKVRALRRSSEIVRSHHERPDGQGYPYGLRSADVPMGARILNVSDAFDAMTSDRPYRRALSVDAALKELKRGAGTQFDAAVVECLVRLRESEQFALIPSPSSEDLLQLRIRPLRARG